jgi:hypothetical protein
MNQVIKKPDSTEMRDAIFRLEGELAKLPQVEIEYVHRFTPGLYTREMRVPAGVMCTGAIHKTEHISIFLEGRMLIPDGNGGSKEIVAPIVETAQPGIKRVGVALEDVRWITVHPTELTDVDEILDEIVTNDPNEAQRIIDASGGMIGLEEDK